MKTIKCTNYIQVKELEEHSQGYDKESFILKRLDGSQVPFIIEIVSPFEVNLIFTEEVKEKQLILTTNINNINNNVVVESTKDDDEIDPGFSIDINSIKLEFMEDMIIIDTPFELTKSDLKIKMEKYTIDNFRDFPKEKKFLELKTLDNYHLNTEIKFEFEKDYIYVFSVCFNHTEKEYFYIHESPTIYYSSIYNVKQLISNFNLFLKETEKTDFDLKLEIWKYSRIAKALAGIATDDIIYDQFNSVLNDYVSQRMVLEMVTRSLRGINITDSVAKENLGNIAVALADLSHGSATVETVTTQLLKVHRELFKNVEELTNKLKDIFSYLQAEKPVYYKGKLLNRGNLKYPYKN